MDHVAAATSSIKICASKTQQNHSVVIDAIDHTRRNVRYISLWHASCN
jgi:hypothetical protein